MSTITVNKLDTQDDSSEFEIETLDDVQSGGATPNLSVPSTNIKDNNQNIQSTTSKLNISMNPNINSTITENNNKENTNPKTNNTSTNTTITENNAKETDNAKDNNKAQIDTADTELVSNLSNFKNSQQLDQAQKTKKKGKKMVVKGATKKKIVQRNQSPNVIENNVQPHVEFGNDRGTMTIKYSSAKTTVPLFSTNKSTHLDLANIKSIFEKEYNYVKKMTNAQLSELRNNMQNTEFSDIGAESLIHGVLSLIDDHDIKKLTLKLMLVQGNLKVKS